MAGRKLTPVQLIEKKRDGLKLSEYEIETFVGSAIGIEGFEQMEDVQIGAMLMAIFLRGLDTEEATYLTKYMMLSGQVLTWEDSEVVVDKHSTGGVGDKVSIPLAPMLAAAGVKVPMISGRGLGHTGGTLDKLDAIPGFSSSKTMAEIQDCVRNIGCVIVGTTEQITPADRTIYKVRDVTGTVWINGLIYASILSKKASEGVKHLLLDLKCGKGCWLDTLEKAEEASKGFTAIASGLGINCICMITNMDTPIGLTVGNALEIEESIDFLKKSKERAKDLEEIVVTQGAVLLVSSKICTTLEEGKQKLLDTIENGTALEKFSQMIQASGVSAEVATKICSDDSDCYACLPEAKFQTLITAPSSGFISVIEALPVGLACNLVGAGRKRSGDSLKYGVGLKFNKKLGDQVNQGEVIAVLYTDEESSHADVTHALDQIQNAITIAQQRPAPQNLIYKF
ncbi:pyrimidine-nucleoside phosphorylase-like [Convolutriloba macropyga]|uniref:pyrimidine-nucleoside phosphorylase-like n=1 Tax=Convolutriloba macropyga TaxID=536237 RepID=UPI003F522CFA